VAQTPFQSYSSDPNAFVAPLNSTETAGITNTNTAAGMADPYYQAAEGLTGAATSAAQGYGQTAQPYFQAATGLTAAGAGSADPSQIDGSTIDKYMSPYLNDVVSTTAKLQNQQNQQALSGQLGNAINSGAFGGDRSGIAAANAYQQMSLANASTNANLLNTGYNNALATAQQQQGVGLSAQQANLARLTNAGAQLGNLGTGAQNAQMQGVNQQLAGATQLATLGAGEQTAGLAGAQAQLAAGQVQQQTSQAGDTALYNQFLQQQSYPFQTAQFLANIAEGTGSLSGSTTTSTQPAPFFSDERLKENIEPIGKTFDGMNIVKFNYKGDKQKQIGLIAQDVEKHHPEAVGLAGGYKTVDYDGATKHAAGLAGSQGRDNVISLAQHRAYRSGGLARLALAEGGQGDWESLLQAQQAMYGGGHGYTRGQPYGGSGVVPPSQSQVHQLQVAQAPKQQASGISQLNDGLKSVESLAKSGNSLKNMGQAAYARVTQPSSGLAPSSDKPAAGGDIPPGVDPDDIGVGSASEFSGGGLAGRKHRDIGGNIDQPSADPYGDDDQANSKERAIPDRQGRYTLATSSPNTSISGSGLGDASKAIGTIVDLGSMFLSEGGLAGRRHYDTGGGDSPDAAPSSDPFNDLVQRDRDPNWTPPAPQQGKRSEISDLYSRDASEGLSPRDPPAAAAAPANVPLPPEKPAELRRAGLNPDNPAPRAVAAKAATEAPAPEGDLNPPAPAAAPSRNANPSESYQLPNPEGQKSGWRAWLKDNQDWLSPMLTGLGTMASSNSRYLGSAILQGAAGAAQDYQNVQNGETNRAATTAGTQNTEQANQGLRIANAKARQINADGIPVGQQQFDENGNLIPQMGFTARNGHSAAQNVPAPNPPPAPPAGQPSNPAPAAAAAPPAPPPPPQRVNIPGVDFDQRAAEAAANANRRVSMQNTPGGTPSLGGVDDRHQAQAESQKTQQDTDAGVSAAIASAQPTAEMMSTIARTPASQTGALATQKAYIGSIAGSIGSVLGLDPQTTAALGSAQSSEELLQKLGTLGAGNMASSAGQHNLQAFEAFLHANPNLEQQPEARNQLAAMIAVSRQNAIDRKNFNEGAYKPASGGTLAGADNEFARVSQARLAAEQNTLAEMLNKKDGIVPDKDPNKTPDWWSRQLQRLWSGRMTRSGVQQFLHLNAPGHEDMARMFPATGD
jgi:hypothetical protein